MEHFDAAMVHASAPLAAVMGDEIALMEVMRLDVGVQLPVSLCREMFPKLSGRTLNVCMPLATTCSSSNSLMHTSYTAIKLWQ